MNSALRSLFALSIYLLVASPTLAESLLVEFNDERPDFNSASMQVDVRIERASVGQSLKHSFQYGQAMPANGTTFVADDQMLTAMQTCLINSSCQITFITSHELAGKVDILLDGFWTWTNQPGFIQTINTFVPQLGPGFTGYQITNITQTINNASLSFSNGSYHGNIAQTVRFYGVAVPEPAACMLAVFCCMAWLSVRFRR